MDAQESVSITVILPTVNVRDLSVATEVPAEANRRSHAHRELRAGLPAAEPFGTPASAGR